MSYFDLICKSKSENQISTGADQKNSIISDTKNAEDYSLRFYHDL
jgi:hypothetical protein